MIGASKGDLVQWVCFDVDFRVPNFHAYPITAGEADVESSVRLIDWGVEFGELAPKLPAKN